MAGQQSIPAQRQSTPVWLWPVVTVGGAALIILYFFNKKDPKAGDSAQLGTEADQKLAALAAQGIYPTDDSSTYESYSSIIVEATDDCGTDEQAIYDVFSALQNEADVWALVKRFGVRQIKSCFSGNYFGNTPYNLPQIIVEELSSSERNTLNSILAQKGITYRF